MSVEEAVDVLVELSLEGEETDDAFSVAIDRLILEVQAEMPCYFNPEIHYASNCVITVPGLRLCPSCTARMKLNQPVPA